MGWTSDLLTGLAETLAAADIGTWNPDGIYQPDETGIVLDVVPTTPDRAIVLAVYLDRPVPGLTDTTGAVQVRMRTGPDPRDLNDLADAVFDLLNESGPYEWGSAYVTTIWRTSIARLGQDANQRLERADNYYFHGHRPSPDFEGDES